MFAKRACMIKNFIYGKTLLAINWKKVLASRQYRKKEVMQIKERGFTQTVLFV